MKDFANLPSCKTHGIYVGRSCPLCPEGFIPDPKKQAEEPDEFAGCRDKWWKGPEGELHELLETWLNFRSVEYIHSRLDKPSTVESGLEDFVCLYTADDGICRACCVELKNRTGRLRKDQRIVIARHLERKIPTLTTGDFDEACEYVRTQLKIDTKG